MVEGKEIGGNMEYTEKEHAVWLLELLNKKDPCRSCPVERLRVSDKVCDVCLKFVSTKIIAFAWCPCHILGPQESIKRTWIALEEKGYI